MASILPPDHIEVAFQCLLGRKPESESVIRTFQSFGEITRVIDTIKNSPEAQSLRKDAPYWHYNAQIDALGVIRSHENRDRQPIAGRFVNFVGVIINPAVYPLLLASLEGQVEGLPIPANWHADIAEFAAALRAVDLAKDTFRVMELGCGWGCWLLITGVAARNRGLKVDLIGAEGDAGHVAFAEAGLAENGFQAHEYRILRGIVGAKEGPALFPRQEVAGESWGLQAVFGASEEEAKQAEESGKFDILPTLTLESIVPASESIDLVHIDIQGGEVGFIESCLSSLVKIVKYIVIGTHSREIEGILISLLAPAGWILEIERPAIFSCHSDGSRITRVDGVQGWRNSALTAAS